VASITFSIHLEIVGSRKASGMFATFEDKEA